MHKKQVSVFIPDSFLSETSDLKLKTYKTGVIGRALAVFNVNQVVIYKDLSYKDDKFAADADFMADVLGYMNTPQYLRKKAYPIKSELKHVGILPPLRTPHHPTDSDVKVGEFRQGFTVKRTKKGTFVDIGMEGRDNLAFCKEQLSVNKIFSFKVTKVAKEVIVTPDEPDDVYWGYEILSTHKSLKNSLKLVKPDFVVETTRYADTINSIFNEFEEKLDSVDKLAIVFGGPYSSISEELDGFSWDLIKVNTVPSQGTETVRTEEAVISTLSIINMLLTS
ncbi:RNA-binding protein [Methanobrevibacter sp. TMH8]|uniref:putative RNA uridine N3 methyltransferase n=1 Tax=Methanobrevibacter sp. TMH8 TaxID=2848611 RepID=UPI001CCBAAB5|nr:putative RNA uridine N3 methyltransferase [Methanobrevibacter sp. TMH8]MBZ9571609.1 RNA-binding protein [Methanobrevibacter sp. TMH8]